MGSRADSVFATTTFKSIAKSSTESRNRLRRVDSLPGRPSRTTLDLPFQRDLCNSSALVHRQTLMTLTNGHESYASRPSCLLHDS
jgi:hypothetical protein